jgi:two-component system, LytTR family, response regulator
MKPIRAIIVDDEPLAREGLRRLLAEEADVECVAECPDGLAAVEAVRAHAPDLLLLDIQMPEMDGFGVLERIAGDDLPVIIFVTAFEEHAIRAFEVHALDYLTKPVDPERFREALERARGELLQRDRKELLGRVMKMLGSLRSRQGGMDRIMLRSAGKITFLRVEEIDWIEAQGDYVCLHALGGKKHLLRERISTMEEQLPPQTFVRIHRSTIINAARIREMQPLYHGDYSVILLDGTRLTLSRSYRDRVFEDLQMAG